jgi:hypothetical protein
MRKRKVKSKAEKGQFSIIAALLISVVLVMTVMVTYSSIRNNPLRESPQVLAAVEEVNFGLKEILEFSLGYYCSMLQVTGNTTYAMGKTESYVRSGLIYISDIHPDWSPSFELTHLEFGINWFDTTSYSYGELSVTYNLTGLGITGMNYNITSILRVSILESEDLSQARINVTIEEGEPLIMLERGNFKFYYYDYLASKWELVTSDSTPLVFSNGTYVIDFPSEINFTANYLVQVVDHRGIVATASSFTYYAYEFLWNQSLYQGLTYDTMTVELLQNGTMRWLGRNLEFTTQTYPIPPIPVKAFRVSVNADPSNRSDLEAKQVPFQIEDWASNYRLPLGLTSNVSVFGSRNMLVFLINHNVHNITLWWNGSDKTTQTSYAFKCIYFTGDDPDNNRLTNGILTLDIITSDSDFQIKATVGSSESTARFMKINDEWSIYGADPAYWIHHGIVRDIIQQEAEWSEGANNCPNLYAYIVITLPANATYYTYNLRFMFLDSLQDRTLSDLCALQVETSVSRNKWTTNWSKIYTENGTQAGMPRISQEEGLFYNFSDLFENGWAHHWAEMIEGGHGFGMMFTTPDNYQLYSFDEISGDKTGGLRISESTIGFQTVTICLKLVDSNRASASFQNALDIQLYGAVVTFDGIDPIYPDAGGTVGLWVLVEYPPTVAPTVNR